MLSLVVGAWSLALWAQRVLLSCLLGPVEGLPGQGPPLPGEEQGSGFNLVLVLVLIFLLAYM